jgi:hypothetical protein
MIYPPAPWTLQGYGLQTLQLIDINTARSLVPSELEIVSLLPGKTLGGIYLSSYQSGSFLEYNELIVVAAYVRYQNRLGAWISHIYVDNFTSVAGGREIWGLPKEMAEFTWTAQGVTVTQNGKTLCKLTHKKSPLKTWWRQKISGRAFGKKDNHFLYFQSDFQSSIGLSKAKLDIAPDSPFVGLGLNKPLLTLNLPDLHLIAGKPEILAYKELAEI